MRRTLAAAGTAVALLLGPAPLAAADPPEASPEAAPMPTPAERAAYWLDRVQHGPEETTWFDLHFHEMLRLDAIENLTATPEATLDRLADPDLQARVKAGEANPWHTILDVLTRIEVAARRSGSPAPPRPDVVRDWAIPALDSPLLTLRRYAVPALVSLGAPEDGPLLADVIDRDGGDGAIASEAAKGLLSLGPPFDGLAARRLLARAVADRAGPTSGLWTGLPTMAASATGKARTDLLAWWALVTEPSGPRAKDPQGGSGHEARTIDPVRMRAVAPDHAWTSGRTPAATARAALGRGGYAVGLHSLTEDLAGTDAALVDLARESLATTGSAPDRQRALALASRMLVTLETLYLRPAAVERLLVTLGGGEAAGESPEPARDAVPSPATVASIANALASDDDAASTDLLARLLQIDLPTKPWIDAMNIAHAALLRRGGAATEGVATLLARSEPETIARAFSLIRDSRRPGYRLLLEPWLDRPEAAPYRAEGRRLLVYLVTTALERGGIGAEELQAFVRKVSQWAADPSDPSAPGLVSALLELGPPGALQFADGLSGPRRPDYVAALSYVPGRMLGPDLVGALLGPITHFTPVAERRAALSAALSVASASCVPVLDALSRRLPPDGRADVAWVRRIVLHRSP